MSLGTLLKIDGTLPPVICANALQRLARVVVRTLVSVTFFKLETADLRVVCSSTATKSDSSTRPCPRLALAVSCSWHKAAMRLASAPETSTVGAAAPRIATPSATA